MQELDRKKINPITRFPIDAEQNTLADSWIELSAQALNHNIATYRALAPSHTKLAAAVKGNAYGHGMIPVAAVLDDHPAIDWLCTASVSEALTLREHGIKKPIIVLSYHDVSVADAIANGIDLVAYDLESALAISRAAQNLGKTANIHIKLDTGLSRLGIRVEPDTVDTTVALIKQIELLPALSVRALFSHFADAESDDHSFVQYQQSLFNAVSSHFKTATHFSCTAAIGTISIEQSDIARFGIGLYGLWPSRENQTAITSLGHNLKPILQWKTRVIQLKQIASGSTIGYDRTHTVARASTIAILPVGYADGIDRKLSNRGHVVIQGQAAPIIGRVSMNMTIVDVTDIPHIKTGDEVLLLGDHAAVHPDTVARHIGTINYEVVTRISPLISRHLVA